MYTYNEQDPSSKSKTESKHKTRISYIEKNPDEWITGTEQMSGDEKSYLQTLAAKAGETFDENLSKVAASHRITNLQYRIGKL